MKFLLTSLFASTYATFDWDTTAEAQFDMTDEEESNVALHVGGGGVGRPNWIVAQASSVEEDPFDVLGDDQPFDLSNIDFDDLTETLLGKVEDDMKQDETDETTSESGESDEVVAEAPKPIRKRNRSSSSSRAVNNPRKRGRPAKIVTTTTTTTPAAFSTMLIGRPEKVQDDKPGRFVFRINVSDKSVNLIDTSKESPSGVSRRVRFAEENEVAYFV